MPHAYGTIKRRCSSMVELQSSKLDTGVRFPLPAPYGGMVGIGRRVGFRFRYLVCMGSSPITPTMIGAQTATNFMESTAN